MSVVSIVIRGGVKKREKGNREEAHCSWKLMEDVEPEHLELGFRFSKRILPIHAVTLCLFQALRHIDELNPKETELIITTDHVGDALFRAIEGLAKPFWRDQINSLRDKLSEFKKVTRDITSFSTLNMMMGGKYVWPEDRAYKKEQNSDDESYKHALREDCPAPIAERQ